MKITLNEIKKEDVLWFYDLIINPEIMQWGQDFPNDFCLDDAKKWIGEYIENKNNKNREYIFIIKNEKNIPVGFTQIGRYNFLNNGMEIGIVLHRDFRGIGIGKLAIKKTISFAIKKLKLSIIIAIINTKNEKSIHFFEKNGFLRQSKANIEDKNNYFAYFAKKGYSKC